MSLFPAAILLRHPVSEGFVTCLPRQKHPGSYLDSDPEDHEGQDLTGLPGDLHAFAVSEARARGWQLHIDGFLAAGRGSEFYDRAQSGRVNSAYLYRPARTRP